MTYIIMLEALSFNFLLFVFFFFFGFVNRKISPNLCCGTPWCVLRYVGVPSYGRKEVEPQHHIVQCIISASLEASNCMCLKNFKVTHVQGNGCIRRPTGRTHWTNFLPTSPKFFFKSLSPQSGEKHEEFAWAFLGNQGRRRRSCDGYKPLFPVVVVFSPSAQL